MTVTFRKHGRWKFADVFLIGIWALLASIVPSFRRRYWSRYVTVSIWTRTIYTPTGDPPSPGLLAHELRHLEQAAEHGRLRHSLRYVLSPRWRIWYEAEAYMVGGADMHDTIEHLMSGLYWLWWPRLHIAGLVLAARIEMHKQAAQ